jgi:Uma2 family endonuclease
MLVQPDVFVVRRDQADSFDWTRMQNLLLAVEVLSPSTRRLDRFTKRRAYQEHRVGTYWIVGTEERCVEVWHPDSTSPVVEHERVTWQPTGASEPLVIEVAAIFPPSS